MGSNKKRQQTISKRNRERAVEEKRRLKRERKQAIREAIRSGEPIPVDPFAPPREHDEPVEQDTVPSAEQETAPAPPETI